MPKYGPQQIRNLVVVGHSHEGKTSLAEAMLYATGATPRLGSTDAGTSTLDFEPEEVKRKISISLGATHVEHDGHKLNILDAPGFFDFIGQVESGISAAEGALLLVSGTGSLAVGTEVTWEQLNRHEMPRVVVVNKLDKENADFFATVTALRDQLTPKPVPIQVPIGSEASFKGLVDLLSGHAYTFDQQGKPQPAEVPDDVHAQVDSYRGQLMEAAAESDDSLLEKYLDQGELSDEEIERGLRAGVRAGTLAPIVCCSATKLVGVRTLMDAIVHLLPAPEVETSGPARAFVFNTTADPFVGRISYFKVLSGCVKSDAALPNASRGSEERLGQLFFPRGKEHANAAEICAGDIGAVAKLQHAHTGDLLGAKNGATPIDTRRLPSPIYVLAIHPKARGDEEKISKGLSGLAEEDPTLRVARNEVTHQVLIAGMGDVHLDVTLEKLKRKYGVEATTDTPKVAYKETVSGHARAEGRHVKQSGGHGQYGVCTIEVEPTARGEGFVWQDKIFGGAIPHNFRPSVEKGIRDAMEKGLVAGYPMVDVKVSLVDGKYHTVDSSDMAFQLAGAHAVRKAAMEANPVLLEPVMHVEVRVPERFLGDIMSELNSKRGKIAGTEPEGHWQIVRGQVPESEMQKFALDLRSITQGRGSFTMEFSHYEEMPQHLAKSLIDQYQKEHAVKE